MRVGPVRLLDALPREARARRMAGRLAGSGAAILLAAACWLASPSVSAAPALGAAQWPLSQPSHRAIFCGAPDTETSFEYSTALNTALSRLSRSGRSVHQAMEVLRGRARCAPGSELPDQTVIELPEFVPSVVGSRP